MLIYFGTNFALTVKLIFRNYSSSAHDMLRYLWG